MIAQDVAHTTKIRELNDAFRRTLTGGKIVVTQGVACRSDLPEIIERVRTFDAFDEGNDPYGEHDSGAIRIGDEQVFWKIDYYDLDLQMGSENPADPNITRRLLTVLLSQEL